MLRLLAGSNWVEMELEPSLPLVDVTLHPFHPVDLPLNHPGDGIFNGLGIGTNRDAGGLHLNRAISGRLLIGSSGIQITPNSKIKRVHTVDKTGLMCLRST